MTKQTKNCYHFIEYKTHMASSENCLIEIKKNDQFEQKIH